MCKYCVREQDGSVTINYNYVKYLCVGSCWGFHNCTTVVYDTKNNCFKLWMDEHLSQPIEFCPKCGEKLKFVPVNY